MGEAFDAVQRCSLDAILPGSHCLDPSNSFQCELLGPISVFAASRNVKPL
jgi:hypothetical protein